MSISAVVFESVRRAATYAAMLFTLNAAEPAAAQPPAARARPAAALAIDGSVAASGLTLAAHHIDARIAGDIASVQVWLLLRNDTTAEVSAQYMLAHPARIVRGDARSGLGRADMASLCEEADLSADAAEHAETAAGRLVQRHDVIVVAPGEQVSVEVLREVPLVVTGRVHRLQLPLPLDPAAPWVPQFTADVLVEADRPVTRLSSTTHPVLVDGLGERTATLSVADGLVHRQAQLAVEFELDTAQGARSLGPDRAAAAAARAERLASTR
jgi:hypothetical protein